MHIYRKVILVFLLTVGSVSAFAQDNPNDALMKEGMALHNQGNYAGAIEKYNAVLKTDPENGYANYELAFSLYASKKGTDALPYLDKAVKADKPKLTVAAYSLIASIYDESHQTSKAIEAYDKAIKIDPDYPQVYYNMGIAYFRNQQYAEAESAAIEAIKHNPKNASSQRLYALVTFHQNKRANALLALCSFILLEPNTPRSVEAYNNIQSILKGGVIKNADGSTTVGVSAKDNKETGTLNTSISLIALSAQTKKLAGVDLLTYELKSTFTMFGELDGKKTEKTFFDKFFVEYFYKLAQSDNMPAMAHTVALTVNKEESAKWAKEHTQEINNMATWLQNTERGF
jgi:tetratricopeptide (TPR) repeat protein